MGGVDVDAVELESGAQTWFADEAPTFEAGAADVSAASDTSAALGAPEGTCGVQEVLSLGGDGGSLVVSFAGRTELREGDEVTVHTCAEPGHSFDVYVGVSASADDPHWLQIVADGSGVVRATVPPLPPVPVE